jgi:hypothetical protein
LEGLSWEDDDGDWSCWFRAWSLAIMFLILVAVVKAWLYPPFCWRTVRGCSTVSVLLIVYRSWSFDTTSLEEGKQNTS